MRVKIGFVAVVTLLLAADAGQDAAAKKELKKLEGSWTVTGFETDGNRMSPDDTKEWSLVVKGDKYTMTFANQVEEGTIKLDPTKEPRTVDITPATGESAGKTRSGIYELSGQQAKACFAAAGEKDRPREFAAKAGSGFYLWEFKRDKP